MAQAQKKKNRQMSQKRATRRGNGARHVVAICDGPDRLPAWTSREVLFESFGASTEMRVTAPARR